MSTNATGMSRAVANLNASRMESPGTNGSDAVIAPAPRVAPIETTGPGQQPAAHSSSGCISGGSSSATACGGASAKSSWTTRPKIAS